jgi:Uma2 family endonuclease
MGTATRMTVEEYYASSVEGDHTQLVEGEIVVSEPKPIHAVLQGLLFVALHGWTEAADGRGQAMLTTNVSLDQYNVYAPDLLWFAEEHRPTDLNRYPLRVPDLCVEIRSPGTWRYDLGAKKSGYERARLPELWLVDDAAETLIAFRRSRPGGPIFDIALELRRDETLTSPQLPGFALPLDELFRR